MTYTLPTWVDGSTPLDSANFVEYNTAINDLDTRVTSAASTASTANTTATAAAAAAAAAVTGVTAGDSSITIAGTAHAPTIAVAQSALTLAPSQVTGLAPILMDSYSSGGQWAPNVYGTQFENMERDDAAGGYIMTSTAKTQLVLLGLVPAGTYSSFKLYVTIAGVGGVMTAALYSSSTMAGTSWARLGAGNVTPVYTTASLVSTSLSFTLAAPAYVVLEMVLTTAPTGAYPTFAASATGVPIALTNPASGCPVSAWLNAATAPASTLNPTTGFTNIAQKIWCALA